MQLKCSIFHFVDVINTLLLPLLGSMSIDTKLGQCEGKKSNYYHKTINKLTRNKTEYYLKYSLFC